MHNETRKLLKDTITVLDDVIDVLAQQYEEDIDLWGEPRPDTDTTLERATSLYMRIMETLED